MRSWSANCQTINLVKCRAPATHVVEHPACRQRSNNLRVMYAESATIGDQEDRRNIAPTRRSLFAPTRRSLFAPTRRSLFAPTRRSLFAPTRRSLLAPTGGLFAPTRRSLFAPTRRSLLAPTGAASS